MCIRDREKEVTIPTFRVATVFDLSQTEGEPLPSLGVDELTGNVADFKKFYAALEKISPMPIGYEDIDTGAKGYCNFEEQRIAVKDVYKRQNRAYQKKRVKTEKTAEYNIKEAVDAGDTVFDREMCIRDSGYDERNGIQNNRFGTCRGLSCSGLLQTVKGR